MPIDNLTLFYGAVFIAGLLAVEGIYFFFFRSRRSGNLEVNRRLRLHSKNPDGREVLDELRKEARGGAGIAGFLDSRIARAGKNYSVSRLVVAMCMVGFMMFLVFTIILPIPPAARFRFRRTERRWPADALLEDEGKRANQ